MAPAAMHAMCSAALAGDRARAAELDALLPALEEVQAFAAQTNDIDLINLEKDAEESGFFEQYPYFSKLAVPAGTYRGVDVDTPSFQDSALWVASSKVPDDVVYDLLSMIYTDEGLAHMRQQKKTFKEMAVETGINGIVTPLHPGAERYFREAGVLP